MLYYNSVIVRIVRFLRNINASGTSFQQQLVWSRSYASSQLSRLDGSPMGRPRCPNPRATASQGRPRPMCRALWERLMAATYHSIAPKLSGSTGARSPASGRIIVPGVDVIRDGREEPFLGSRPTLSSVSAKWGGIVLENYTVPAVFIPRHEHPEHFLHFGAARQCRISGTHGRPRSPVHVPSWDDLSSSSRDSG